MKRYIIIFTVTALSIVLGNQLHAQSFLLYNGTGLQSSSLKESTNTHYIGLSLDPTFTPTASFHIQTAIGLSNSLLLVEPLSSGTEGVDLVGFMGHYGNNGIFDMVQAGQFYKGNWFQNRVGINMQPSSLYYLAVDGGIRSTGLDLTGPDGINYLNNNSSAPFYIKYGGNNSIRIDDIGSSVSGLLKCDAFQLSKKNCNNFVLVSDEDGNGTWQDPSLFNFWIKDNNVLNTADGIKRVGVNGGRVLSDFQVNNGPGMVSMGSLCDDGFKFQSSSYLGFNAARTSDDFGTAGSNYWVLNPNDDGENGGSVIWTNLEGYMFFSPIGKDDNTKTAGSQYLKDEDIQNRVKMTITPGGSIGINTPPVDDYTLAVKGKVLAEEMDVMLANEWPDYVFHTNYNLPDLKDVETYIQENSHLPGVPSSDEVQKKGVNVGEMNAILLQKVEELTLYVISLKKEVEQLKSEHLSK
jgi:hypothetical protein